MTGKQDRRVRRTRKLIQDAFFDLMENIPYQKITINQITEEADISRSTFYLHYDTKEDLLLSIVDEIIDKYFEAIDQPINDRVTKPADYLFTTWKQNLKRMKLIIDTGMEYRIYQRFRVFNKQRDVPLQNKNLVLEEYIRAMLDGAIFALLIEWTKENASIPVEDMKQLYEGLDIPSLFRKLEETVPQFGMQ